MPELSVANALRRPRALRPPLAARATAATAQAAAVNPARPARSRPAAAEPLAPAPVSTLGEDRIDTSYLETLLGYNARRAALSVIAVFLQRMAPYGLRPVDFSVLTLIAHNPGITSRQICAALDILPPNLVGMIKSLDKRGLIERRAHPTDRRAQGLHLSPQGRRLQKGAQATATLLERDVASALTDAELATLKTLLQRVYRR